MLSLLIKSFVLLVAAVLAYRKAHNDWIVAKKNTSDEKKAALGRLKRDAIVSAGLMTVLAAFLFASELRDKLHGENLNAARHEEISRKADTVNTNISNLATHQSALVATLATNKAVDPRLRLDMLAHSRPVELLNPGASDLDRWKSDFKREQEAATQNDQAARLKHEIMLEERKSDQQARVDQTWKRAIPMFDFIIRAVQTSIQDIAKSKGERVFSNYAGLPSSLLADKITSIATITTGTNLAWFFEVSAEGISRGDAAEVWLRVQGSCTNHAGVVRLMTRGLSAAGSPEKAIVNVECVLQVHPLHLGIPQAIDSESYQTNLMSWVHRFIGAHATLCDSR